MTKKEMAILLANATNYLSVINDQINLGGLAIVQQNAINSYVWQLPEKLREKFFHNESFSEKDFV